ncbi:MAG: hypothetical protein JWN95_310 [Frankiales bacterium]|nr:hypothetical protein [Frankiales bacterium]
MTRPPESRPARRPGRDRSISLVSTALLDDLLTNTLDPGYRSAHDRGLPRHWWDGPLAAAGALLIGLVLVLAYQQTHRSAPAREAARSDLISRIHDLQKAGGTLDDRAKLLGAQVAALRDQQLSGTDRTSLRAAELAAGSTAIKGPGMQVDFGEPSSTPSATVGERPGLSQQPFIHDVDVRAVANQLWLSGAEAVEVNGIRLTSTSAIRFAGDSVLVDFQTISSPYTVRAVGDRDKMQLAFVDSAIARRLKTMEAVDDISFSFEGRSSMSLAAAAVSQPGYALIGVAPSASRSPR